MVDRAFSASARFAAIPTVDEHVATRLVHALQDVNRSGVAKPRARGGVLRDRRAPGPCEGRGAVGELGAWEAVVHALVVVLHLCDKYLGQLQRADGVPEPQRPDREVRVLDVPLLGPEPARVHLLRAAVHPKVCLPMRDVVVAPRSNSHIRSDDAERIRAPLCTGVHEHEPVPRQGQRADARVQVVASHIPREAALAQHGQRHLKGREGQIRGVQEVEAISMILATVEVRAVPRHQVVLPALPPGPNLAQSVACRLPIGMNLHHLLGVAGVLRVIVEEAVASVVRVDEAGHILSIRTQVVQHPVVVHAAAAAPRHDLAEVRDVDQGLGDVVDADLALARQAGEEEVANSAHLNPPCRAKHIRVALVRMHTAGQA
mmetsp:Transcript_79374/g.227734  ORF Transcript_79374/g.227734 Transcript_79374/m.227734 type:complete len:374 (+) Transcript_79374:802-1923(+)